MSLNNISNHQFQHRVQHNDVPLSIGQQPIYTHVSNEQRDQAQRQGIPPQVPHMGSVIPQHNQPRTTIQLPGSATLTQMNAPMRGEQFILPPGYAGQNPNVVPQSAVFSYPSGVFMPPGVPNQFYQYQQQPGHFIPAHILLAQQYHSANQQSAGASVPQQQMVPTHQAPQIQQAHPTPRDKKVLTIRDPESHKAINDEIVQSTPGKNTNSETKQDTKLSEQNEEARAHEVKKQFTEQIAEKFKEDKQNANNKDAEHLSDKHEVEEIVSQNTLVSSLSEHNANLEEINQSQLPQVMEPAENNVPKFVPSFKLTSNDSEQQEFRPETHFERVIITEDLVIEFSEKLNTFFEETTHVEEMVYGRQFLLIVRDVVKSLKTVDCPKTPSELVKLGLDRSSDLAIASNNPQNLRQKKFDGHDAFKMNWQQTNSGGGTSRLSGVGSKASPYAGRHSDKPSSRKKPMVGRGSMDPKSKQSNYMPMATLPKKSSSAWKTKREIRFDENAPKNQDEQKYDRTIKEMRGLLNKITPTTFDDLSDDFIDRANQADQELLKGIIDLIFLKAVEEPHFCSLYSDLCKKQADLEIKNQQKQSSDMNNKPDSIMTFRQGIILKCQQTFAPQSSNEKIAELETKISAESDEKAKDQMQEEIEILKSNEKRRLLGIIRFIAQLYRRKLLIDSIITWCVFELFKKQIRESDEIYIEYAVQMIETVGEIYESNLKKTTKENETKQQPQQAWDNKKNQSQQQPTQIDFDKIISHFVQLKPSLSNRIKFMIMGLEDLRRDNWKPRGGDKGPKTVEAVRNEAKQEQEQNEEERMAYEHRKQVERSDRREKDGKRPSYNQRASANFYSGRSSMESRSQQSSSGSNRIQSTKLSEVDSSTNSSFKKGAWYSSLQQQQQNKQRSTEPTPPPDDKSSADRVELLNCS